MEYNLKREWRYQFTAERWGRFLHTRLWLGLPVAAAISFIIIVLIGLGGGMEQKLLLTLAGKEALICAVAALFGIFIATASTPEAVREKISQDRAEAEALYQSTPKWKAIIWVTLFALLLAALIFTPILLSEGWGSWKDPEGAIRIAGGVLAGTTIVAIQLVQEIVDRKTISA